MKVKKCGEITMKVQDADKRAFMQTEKKAEKPIVLTIKNIKISKRGYIYIQKYTNGLHIRVSTHLKDTEANKKYVLEHGDIFMRKELAKRGYNVFEPQRMPDEYLYESMEHLTDAIACDLKEATHRKYACFTEQMKKAFPHLRTNNVDRNFLHNYALKLHHKGASKSNIKFKISFILRAVNDYNLFFSLPTISKNDIHIKKMGRNIKEKEGFTADELIKLVEEAENEQLKLYLAIASHTGARVGEILALNGSDVDFNTETIRINKTRARNGKITEPKTQSANRVIGFLNESFKEKLQKLMPRRKGAIFTITSTQLQTLWKKLLTKLRFKKRPIYNIRHSFASIALQKTENITAVQQTLGHTDISTTLRHYIIARNPLKFNL